MSYQVIRDNREQNGWTFPKSDRCLGTIPGTLKTGDYSLVGYEDVLSIERKGSVQEFYHNVTEKRFERELERLDAFRFAFVILEFQVSDIVAFPLTSGIPEKKWKDLRATPQFLMKRLNDFQVKYRAKFITVGDKGREYVSSLFKRVVEHVG